MSQYIKEQINIVFNKPVETTTLEMLNELFIDIDPGQLEAVILSDERTVDIQIDADTNVSYSSLDLMNRLHNGNPDVKSILIIDTDTNFGSYSYLKTDKTSAEDAGDLVRWFIDGIKDNVGESAVNVNWQ